MLSEGLKSLPETWSLSEPLCVGAKVVFTGCDPCRREALEHRAERAGVRVMSAVSRRTAMLVADGNLHGTKADTPALLGTRVVTTDEFETLLTYLQPGDALGRITPLPRGESSASRAQPPGESSR